MPVDKVLLAAPRGFCAGVEMAIKALAWMVRAFEPPVYCYHEIVHNQLVVDRFRDLGVVFVDDIAEVPEGRPIMLSAHGSAPEVVAAARARGSYVVDAVCPLVTKVHHEVKVRAGKGYRIVYVGHEGHEEAVGTMAVAPDAIHLVESIADVDALPPVRPARRPAGPDHAVAPRLGGRRRRGPHERFPGLWLPGPQRPVLRHHQPPVGAGRSPPAATPWSSSGRPTRPTPGRWRSWPTSRAAPASTGSTPPTSCPTTSTGIVGVTAGASAPEELVDAVIARLGPARGSRRCAITDEDEYFPPPRDLRDLLAGVDVLATFGFGGSVPTAPRSTTATCRASDVLAMLA